MIGQISRLATAQLGEGRLEPAAALADRVRASAAGWSVAPPAAGQVAQADALAAAAAGWSVALLALFLVAWQRRRFDGAGRLVAEAAHELRGPLCAARLAIGSLERVFADVPTVGARLAAIDAELSRAGLAVDDLGAALETGRSPAESELVDLNELLTQHEPVWSSIAGVHGAVLAVRPGPRPARVLANRLRLAQAMGNLVANGCEHGGGVVTVQVRVTGECLRVEVSDHGRGLPGPIGELIARRPRSAPGRAPYAARGHGLTVARRVAEELGGSLAAAPAQRGARLVLELPAAPPPAPALSGARPAPPAVTAFALSRAVTAASARRRAS